MQKLSQRLKILFLSQKFPAANSACVCKLILALDGLLPPKKGSHFLCCWKSWHGAWVWLGHFYFIFSINFSRFRTLIVSVQKVVHQGSYHVLVSLKAFRDDD